MKERIHIWCSCNQCKHPWNKLRQYERKRVHKLKRHLYKQNLKQGIYDIIEKSIWYTD